MNRHEDLEREFIRVARLETFRPGERIWWIYLRNAAGRWLEGEDDERLRAAYDRLKAFPENLPNEAPHWMELRAAAAGVLGRSR